MRPNGKFKACIKCVPPERKPGCHDTCERYLAEKWVNDAKNEKEKAEREKRDFLNYVEEKRTRRIERRKNK